MIATIAAAAIRFLCGARAHGHPDAHCSRPVVYFANHTSHLDFPLVWAALDPRIRAVTRPVAAADYWGRSRSRRILALGVFNAILIDRGHVSRRNHPVKLLADAVAHGQSLIVFPEGTRSSDARIRPFKSGLFYLTKALPDTLFIPVYIDNLNRILPKGEFIPVPMMSSITFGLPMEAHAGEHRNAFLARALNALEAMAPL